MLIVINLNRHIAQKTAEWMDSIKSDVLLDGLLLTQTSVWQEEKKEVVLEGSPKAARAGTICICCSQPQKRYCT